MKINIRTITYGGVLSAVILLTTLIHITIPSGYGYVNFGDGAIFASAAIMGPFAAISAALGSALADLLVGAPQYMLATFLIKGSMGLLAGFTCKKYPKLALIKLAGLFILCEIIMVGGYFVTEWIMYDRSIAIGNLIFNAIQGLAGIVMGLAIVPLARKIKI